MKPFISLLITFQIILTCFDSIAGEKTDSKKVKSVNKTATNDFTNQIDINNLTYYFQNNGIGATNSTNGNYANGLIYPFGSNLSVVYEDGFLWAGKVQLPNSTEDLRAGGSTYRSGLQAGPILTSGSVNGGNYTNPIADDPTAQINRILKLNKGEINSPDYTFWKAYAFGGAPLDENGNPKVYGDQTLYYTANDMNTSKVNYLYGSKPIGIEVQSTIWGLKNSFGLQNVFFTKKKIINKSGLTIKEMYLSVWSDPDLGYAGDDVIGVDTLLKLGYCYNFDSTDQQYGSTPPAVGYYLFQGVRVPTGIPSDSAFSNDHWVKGFKNLSLSGFSSYIGGGPISERDPALGSYNGTNELYNYMKGLNADGNPIKNRFGIKTKFPYSGDPNDPNSDLDGYVYAKGDRRILISTGPFTLAPGDTQEIIYATLVGQGSNNIQSVSNLKNAVKMIEYTLKENKSIKKQKVTVDRTTNQTVFGFSGDFSSISPTSNPVIFAHKSDNSSVFSMTLFDDGNHNDGSANDKIFANSSVVPNQKGPSSIDLTFTDKNGSQIFNNGLENIILRPIPVIGNFNIVNENGAQDKSFNSGETAWFSFTLENKDGINSIDEFKITNSKYYFSSVNQSAITNPLDFYSKPLNLWHLSQLWEIDSTKFDFVFIFDGNRIQIPVSFPIKSWSPDTSLWKKSIPVTLSKGFGSYLNPVIAQPEVLTGHTYEVTFYSKDDSLLWKLTDINLSEIKLEDQPLNTRPGMVVDGIIWNNSAVKPGFKDFLTVSNAAGQINPPEYGALDPNNQGFPRFSSPTRNQTISKQQIATGLGSGWGIHVNPFGSAPADVNYDYFLNRLTRNGANWPVIGAYDYELRFTVGGGKAINWYSNHNVIDVPFEIWNIGANTPNDPSDDYRMIPWINNSQNDPDKFDIGGDHFYSNGSDDPFSDWIYWMTPVDKRQGQFGYNADIADAVADPVNYSGDKVDSEVFARMVISCWNGGTAAPYDRPMPENGTTFRIITNKPNFPGDILSVTAPVSTGVFGNNIPKTFNLYQNYPNPFNPTTTINYDIPSLSFVTLEIVNVLGQKVATIVNSIQQPGNQAQHWNGKNLKGQSVSSGVYFYKLTARSVNGGAELSQIKKMILLK